MPCDFGLAHAGDGAGDSSLVRYRGRLWSSGRAVSPVLRVSWSRGASWSVIWASGSEDFTESQKLQQDGLSVSGIGRQLHVDRKTVPKYLGQAPRAEAEHLEYRFISRIIFANAGYWAFRAHRD